MKPIIRSGSLCAILGAVALYACSAQDPSSDHTGSAETALGTQQFTVELPAGVKPGAVTLSAYGVLNDDRNAVLQGSFGSFGAMANAGTVGATGAAAGSTVGSITSVGAVSLNTGLVVNGNVTSNGIVATFPGATVTGTTTSLATLTPLAPVSWTSPASGTSAGDVSVASAKTNNLAPGTYGNVSVLAGGTLKLATGTYFLTSFSVAATASVAFTGPTVVYVTSSVSYAGTMTDTIGDGSLLLAYSGISGVTIGGSFVGTFVAPNAPITVNGPKQVGAFFTHDIEVAASATIQHENFPLPPSTCIGAADGTACSTSGSGKSVCESGSCVNVTCSQTPPAGNDSETLTVVSDFGTGPVTYTRTTTAAFLASPTTTTMSISLAGQTLETQNITGPTTTAAGTTKTTFGAAFHGMHEFDVTNGVSTANAVLDGRTLQPMSNSPSPSIVFADGKGPPLVTVDDGIPAIMAKISALANKAASVCGAPPPAVMTLSSPLPQFDVAGHVTTSENLPSCDSCQTSCSNSFYTCSGAAVASGIGGEVGAVFVPWPGNLIAALATLVVEGFVEVGCSVAQDSCRSNCNNIGAGCCPVNCGGHEGLCCNSNEFCLDAANDLCCSDTYTACPGPHESCYDATQATCLPSGAACPFNTPTCGTGVNELCCPSNLCVNGQCLPPSGFGIKANAKATEGGGPLYCVVGTGFTPGATVTSTLTDASGRRGPYDQCRTDRGGQLDVHLRRPLLRQLRRRRPDVLAGRPDRKRDHQFDRRGHPGRNGQDDDHDPDQGSLVRQRQRRFRWRRDRQRSVHPMTAD